MVCPPIPTHAQIIRPVYITAVPSSSSLRYVYELVMTGKRGAIGWDQTGDALILYFKVEPHDNQAFPDLQVGSEYWACFRVKDDQG